MPHGTKTNDTYLITAGIRGKRLIIFQRAKSGDESPHVAVYPTFDKSYRDFHAGVVVKETWDGEDLIVPSLICNYRPSGLETISEGIVPQGMYESLTELWRQNASGYLTLFREELAVLGQGKQAVE